MDRRSFLEAVGGAAALSQASTRQRISGSQRRSAAGSRVSGGSTWLEALTSATPIFLRERPGKDAVFPLKPETAASRRLDEMRDAGIGNWGTDEFQEEAEKIVRFWMDTGIDGMMIDAVNWYVGCNWERNRRRMTDAIASYGNDKYSQPEGAGAFHEDPVPWITDRAWTCVQDYGLGIFWEKGTNVVTNAIANGDPRPIERGLRDYHDRVVEAGGILYFNPPRFDDARKSRLATAFAAAAGDLVCWASVIDGLWSPVFPDADEARLMALKAKHPSMHNRSRRQTLPTNAPEKHYAFLRAARDGSERMIVVLNFQPEEQAVEIDVSGVAFDTATDLIDGGRATRVSPWRVVVPAFGYRFFRLDGRRGEHA
jgi:hypothetical protein